MNNTSNVFEFLVSEFLEFDVYMNKPGYEYTPEKGVLVARVFGREEKRMKETLTAISNTWWCERATEQPGYTFQVGDREETNEAYLAACRSYQEALIAAGFDTRLDIKGPTVSYTALFVTIPPTFREDALKVSDRYLSLLSQTLTNTKGKAS